MIDTSDLQWLVRTNKILMCYEYANLRWQTAPCVASGQNIDEVPIWSVSVASFVSFRTVLTHMYQDNMASRPRNMHGLGKGGPRRIQFLGDEKLVLWGCLTDVHDFGYTLLALWLWVFSSGKQVPSEYCQVIKSTVNYASFLWVRQVNEWLPLLLLPAPLWLCWSLPHSRIHTGWLWVTSKGASKTHPSALGPPCPMAKLPLPPTPPLKSLQRKYWDVLIHPI